MPEVWLALGLSALSIFVWAVLMGRNVAVLAHHEERRVVATMMYAVGLLASVGTFSSALGNAEANGLLGSIIIDHMVIVFVASVGRGALLVGGVALLVLWPSMHGDRTGD